MNYIDYKELYEATFKYAKQLYDAGSYDNETIEAIFPELKENKDEVVRKQLLEMVHDTTGDSLWVDYNIHKEDAIAWLEEQGEPTKINPSEFDSQLNKLLKQFESLSKKELASSLRFYLNVVQNDGTYKSDEKQGEQKVPDVAVVHKELNEYLKQQGEQNPADKVEPKFHKGDWVVLSTSDREKVVQIDFIEYFKSGEPKYITSEGRWFGNGTKAHLWTIQDAKDGDVLYSPCCKLLWIYKDEKTCHVGYNLNYNSGSIVINKPICIPTDVCPATKDEQTIIFTEIKEAGYEWDAEKKELKKIENEIEIPFGAKDSELQEVTYYIPEGFHAEIDDDKVVIKKGEKPAWSKDKKIIEALISLCETAQDDFPQLSTEFTHIEALKDWLKEHKNQSLRPQSQWKPSDEQMLAIKTSINVVGKGSLTGKCLEEMLEQLKKLREE